MNVLDIYYLFINYYYIQIAEILVFDMYQEYLIQINFY